MIWKENRPLRIAILDLNACHENQGMRCIREIIKLWGESNLLEIELEEFEVRVKLQTPGLDFDVYISSGGPGSPLASAGGEWDNCYFSWLKSVEKWNDDKDNFSKKYIFFICHSFQLACRYYKIGNICKRNSNSFGIFPVHLTDAANEEPVFEGLNNPFYAVDNRDFQLIEPDITILEEMGAKILALEKERPHIPLERAIMALRFNEFFIGTQFHPEADPVGMSMYLQREDKKKGIIDNYGFAKWNSMIEHLNDPDKILFTYSHILPNFLSRAVGCEVEA